MPLKRASAAGQSELLGLSGNAEIDWNEAIRRSSKAEVLGLRSVRAASRARAGLLPPAIEEASALERNPELGPIEAYNLACIYSLASASGERERRDFGTAAIRQLSLAIHAGYGDVAQLNADPDLDPIREREDFQQLIDQLERASAP